MPGAPVPNPLMGAFSAGVVFALFQGAFYKVRSSPGGAWGVEACPPAMCLHCLLPSSSLLVACLETLCSEAGASSCSHRALPSRVWAPLAPAWLQLGEKFSGPKVADENQFAKVKAMLTSLGLAVRPGGR